MLLHLPILMLEKPVVLFMKGTPGAPQCGFSRATVQILGLQGVDPQKFASHNVLEDQELRSGISFSLNNLTFRNKRVLVMAYCTTAIC
jgi:glutaredoxin-related protein